jgi:hypothetical protein
MLSSLIVAGADCNFFLTLAFLVVVQSAARVDEATSSALAKLLDEAAVLEGAAEEDVE